MIKIQKLTKPSKRSGHELKPGSSTKVRGVMIVNQNSFPIYIDKFTKKKKK